MARPWLRALLRCSALDLVSSQQVTAIRENLNEKPEFQQEADDIAGMWKMNEDEKPPRDVVEYFKALNNEQELSRNVKQRALTAIEMPHLGMSDLRAVAVPAGSDHSLGRITSSLVAWVCAPMDVEAEPSLREWWETNATCKDTILEGGSHRNIFEELKTKNLKVLDVDENKKKEVYRQEYEAFMRVVEACMGEILKRLGVHWKLSIVCDKQALLSTSQFPDGALLKDDLLWLGAEGQNEDEEEKARDHKIAEGRGGLVRLANQIFVSKYAARGMFPGCHPPWKSVFRGFTFTGRRVQAVTLSHQAVGKPSGLATPLQLLVNETTENDNVPSQEPEQGQQLAERLASEGLLVDVYSPGMQVIVKQCLVATVSELNLRARAEEAEDFWRRDKVVRAKEEQGFMIGNRLVRVSGRSKSSSEMELVVKSFVRATVTGIVVSVWWKGATWWLKLGSNRSERRLEMALPECYWEPWFQVERDALCHHLVGSDLQVIPVEVSGVDRPAMLIQDAGLSLSEMRSSITPSQVWEMSKQMFEVLARQACGVFHNDVAPRNICFRDGTYRLIDWGCACGPKLRVLEEAVAEAWKSTSLVVPLSPVLDWKLSPDRCLFNVPTQDVRDSMEGLFYCCLELINGELPWSDAVAEQQHRCVIMQHRWATKAVMREHPNFLNAAFIYQPVVQLALTVPRSPWEDKVQLQTSGSDPSAQEAAEASPVQGKGGMKRIYSQLLL